MEQTFFVPKNFKIKRPGVFGMKIAPMMKEFIRTRAVELGVPMSDYVHSLIVSDLQRLGRLPASELTDGVEEAKKKGE